MTSPTEPDKSPRGVSYFLSGTVVGLVLSVVIHIFDNVVRAFTGWSWW